MLELTIGLVGGRMNINKNTFFPLFPGGMIKSRCVEPVTFAVMRWRHVFELSPLMAIFMLAFGPLAIGSQAPDGTNTITIRLGACNVDITYNKNTFPSQ